MSPSESTPSPSEEVVARLLIELDQLQSSGRSAVVDRYIRDNPEHAAKIRELVAIDADVRPPLGDGASRRLQPEQRLGPFRVVRFVAQGGMGEVYEAVQDLLDRRVALKVIRHGSVSPTARARFRREVQVLARLHQTNTVPVHHAGEEGELEYCAMQFVDGAPLHKIVTEVLRLETSAPGRRQTPPIRDVVGSLLRLTSAEPAKAATAGAEKPHMPKTPGLSSSPPLALSPKYFVSVAAVMIQVAEAVQHCHEHGFCHRDVKPSNIMIDSTEMCRVIDFGLAGALNPQADLVPSEGTAADPRLTQGPLGTPQYMSPEQFDGKADSRSDVWSLGVTLYELLTLRPAFHAEGWAATRELVVHSEPKDPRELVDNVPADLVAICRKAMSKDPAGRFASARAFADDLRRWSNWEPTEVRPGWGTLRPLRLWAWRKKAWAAAVLAVAILLVGSTAWAIQRAEQRKQELERQKRELEYNRVVLECEDIRHGTPYIGWSDDSLSKLKEARRIRPDVDLRATAAATLIGPDVRLVRIHNLQAPAPGAVVGLAGVAFGTDGRVLAGGLLSENGNRVDRSPALLFDSHLARKPTASARHGSGPVAFADPDTPVQLVMPARDEDAFVLWPVGANRKLAEIPVPIKGGEKLLAALSEDARLAAVSATDPSDKDGKRPGVTQLWALDPKKPGAEKELKGWDRPSSALAFSPDGKYLAVGTQEGAVSIRATADGAEVLTLENGHLPVLSLAFGRNFWKSALDKPRRDPNGIPGYLLAVGTKSGTTHVWNLETKKQVNVLRGTAHYVNAVAFGPDGTTLVTAGYQAPIRWNVATGREEFALRTTRDELTTHYVTGVAVSPDGRQVAWTSTNELGVRDYGLRVAAFDEGRGVRTFRGLVGEIQFIVFSPSTRWVAALSQGWQVGVWDRETGQVAYVWDVPVGTTVDNAALAFDEKEESVYYASGERACRLDLKSGGRTGNWKLPLGLNDNLAVRPGQKPMLLRREPVGPRPWKSWVYRSRELLDDGMFRDRFQTPAGDGISSISLDASGKYFIAVSKRERIPRVFDGDTGKQIPWPADLPFTVDLIASFVTNNGRLLWLSGMDKDGELVQAYRLPEMTLQKQGRFPGLLSVDDAGTLGAGIQTDEVPDGLPLYRFGEDRPFLTLDVGRTPRGVASRHLTRDGRFCVWGRADGTVCLADISRCIEQLAAFPVR